MKIFGICGSPRQNGNSQWALSKLLEACEKNGHQTSTILLSTATIKLCDGSLTEEIGNKDFDDDMQIVKKGMLEADAIVFCSPTYFDNTTPHLKNLIDRTDPFYEELKGKAALILVVGQANDEGSRTAVVNYLKTYCEIAEMTVKGAAAFRAANKGDIQKISGIDDKLSALAQCLEV
ncbi:MAG: flavodoxin family protein [Bdellovibrionales bacterium]|jgi:multimeric flavodoxin WrbA